MQPEQMKVLGVLNGALADRTYLGAKWLTVADIAVWAAARPIMVRERSRCASSCKAGRALAHPYHWRALPPLKASLDGARRESAPHFTRWFRLVQEWPVLAAAAPPVRAVHV